MRSSNCDYSLKWLLEDENGKKRQKTKSTSQGEVLFRGIDEA